MAHQVDGIVARISRMQIRIETVLAENRALNEISRRLDLSIYDASYLELAQRRGLPPPPAPKSPVSEFATRAKAAWARLIRKGYEADPMECPRCKGPMRAIALIDDPHVVRRILEHLGRWAPEPAERGPPGQAPD